MGGGGGGGGREAWKKRTGGGRGQGGHVGRTRDGQHRGGAGGREGHREASGGGRRGREKGREGRRRGERGGKGGRNSRQSGQRDGRVGVRTEEDDDDRDVVLGVPEKGCVAEVLADVLSASLGQTLVHKVRQLVRLGDVPETIRGQDRPLVLVGEVVAEDVGRGNDEVLEGKVSNGTGDSKDSIDAPGTKADNSTARGLDTGSFAFSRRAVDGSQQDDLVSAFDEALTVASIADDELLVVTDPHGERSGSTTLVLGRLLDVVDELVGLVERVLDRLLEVRVEAVVDEDVAVEVAARELGGVVAIVSIINGKETVLGGGLSFRQVEPLVDVTDDADLVLVGLTGPDDGEEVDVELRITDGVGLGEGVAEGGVVVVDGFLDEFLELLHVHHVVCHVLHHNHWRRLLLWRWAADSSPAFSQC